MFSFTNPSIIIENSVFNTNILDSVYFDIEHIIETGQDDFKQNDTLKEFKNFYHTFLMMMEVLNLLMVLMFQVQGWHIILN